MEIYRKLDSFRFVTSKGEISLLHPSRVTDNYFEIYCIKGNLFEDVKRFDTEKEAIIAIGKFLCTV